MSQRSYVLISGVVFLLIALAHFFRVVFGLSFVVYDVPVPMWASVLAVVVMGFLAYQGFRLGRKAGGGG